MTQALAVTAFAANLVINAGETINITGINRLNLNTRKLILDDTGTAVEFSATVAQDVTLDGAGAGTIIITGPALNEVNGQYNTTDVAMTGGEVVTLGGTASTSYMPNLFWHKQAFGIGSVDIKKLHSTDTIGTTEDGLRIRVSKGADFLANKQMVRFDLRPAFAAFNPYFSGQGWGA